jgi:tRNA-intron endonuclease
MGKEAVVAVIERRGEVIYYKASKMRFTENRYRQNNE